MINHMISSMAPITGRMAVVLPQGALFRGGAEAKIRKKFQEMDLIEAVIGQAPNLFHGTGLAASIMVLRRRKPPERAGQVPIIDASQLFRKGRAQNCLEPEHAAEILSWVHRFEGVKHRARVVLMEEISEEDRTLNISRYLLPPIVEDIPLLPEIIADFKATLAMVQDAEDNLRRIME